MRLSPIACIVFVCHALPANGQEPQIYGATAPPPSARFEIFQSEHPHRSTLRLDRFTGQIHLLIQVSNREYTWQEMEVTERPESSISSRPRFQLFTSSNLGRHTLLLDADTGSTWELNFTEKRLVYGRVIPVWTPIK
jgi:hypothetical protein